MPDSEDPYIEMYRAYRGAFQSRLFQGKLMPYGWYDLPSRLNVEWMPYAQMLSEYAGELANTVNALATTIHRLAAWAAVLPTLSIERRFDAKLEFIDPLGTAALGMPYAIKSRFTFVTGHLCHQANRASDPDWVDNFPSDNALYLNDIEPFGVGWKRFRRFKRSVESIGGRRYRQQSEDFRHSYNHRVPPQLVLGNSRLVSRVASSDGSVSYTFGGAAPLNIEDMATLLVREHDLCCIAFVRFQELVHEQLEVIRRRQSIDGN